MTKLTGPLAFAATPVALAWRGGTLPTLLEAAPEAIVVTKRDGKSLWSMPKPRVYSAHPRQELFGLNVEGLLPGASGTGIVKKWARTVCVS